MFIEKWYADVVDDQRVDILYRANLKVGPAVLGYEGHIASAGRASASVVPGGIELPREGEGSLSWPASAAGHDAALRWADSQSRDIALWRDDRRLLNWNPMVLNGRVSGFGLSAQARGYVEKLTLNFGPWRLGLARLKWGRFCGQRHGLVWIEWEGRIPLRLALLDGEAGQLREASRERIACDGALLHLTQRRALVEESIADGALRGLRLPRRPVALQFLRAVETKWFALGTLESDNAAADSGHAIFEEVVW